MFDDPLVVLWSSVVVIIIILGVIRRIFGSAREDITGSSEQKQPRVSDCLSILSPPGYLAYLRHCHQRGDCIVVGWTGG